MAYSARCRRKATESEPAEPQAKWYRVTAAADRRDPSDTTGSKPTATPAAVPAATPPMTTTHEQLQQYLPAPRRGRPPKHQVFAVSEEERKRRRQHSNRLSARRSYYRRLCKIEKLQEVRALSPLALLQARTTLQPLLPANTHTCASAISHGYVDVCSTAHARAHTHGFAIGLGSSVFRD